MKLTHDLIERRTGLLIALVLLVVSVGGLVEIVPLFFQRSTTEPVAGRKVIEGALVSADAEAIVIASDGGELRVPYANVASARTVFEWGTARSR